MARDIFFEIHQDLPREGVGKDKYTRKAFRMLPRFEKPRILDVGCGPGSPTIELAKLSNGHVIGIDVHQPYLDKLKKKAKEEGIQGRVKALKASMFAMDFPEESFDIIWAEGSIFIIGFERGLKEWKQFLKPRGFLVVHDVTWLEPNPPKKIYDYFKKVYPAIKTIEENLKMIPKCGYKIIGYFPLPEDAWWEEYYNPLEERIQALRQKYRGDSQALSVLESEQQEIEMYRKYSKWYSSVFYIMQKR